MKSVSYVSSIFLEYHDKDHIDKIRNFDSLEDGWNHGEGVAPTEEVINQALLISNYLYNNCLLVDPIPGLEGEIQLLSAPLINKEHYIEITINSDISLNYTEIKKTESGWNVLKDIDLKNIKEIKEQIENYLKCILEYYQKDNLLKKLADSEALPSKITGVESQSSVWTVSTKPVCQFVII